MRRFFTHYWSNKTWKAAYKKGRAGQPLERSGSEHFCERGVRPGDHVYVVTVQEGALNLLGKMEVGRICNREEAAKFLGRKLEDVFPVSEHVVASKCTRMEFDRPVMDEVSRELRFVRDGKVSALVYREDKLDNQTMGKVRELTADSAARLDSLLPAMEPFTPVGA